MSPRIWDICGHTCIICEHIFAIRGQNNACIVCHIEHTYMVHDHSEHELKREQNILPGFPSTNHQLTAKLFQCKKQEHIIFVSFLFWKCQIPTPNDNVIKPRSLFCMHSPKNMSFAGVRMTEQFVPVPLVTKPQEEKNLTNKKTQIFTGVWRQRPSSCSMQKSEKCTTLSCLLFKVRSMDLEQPCGVLFANKTRH